MSTQGIGIVLTMWFQDFLDNQERFGHLFLTLNSTSHNIEPTGSGVKVSLFVADVL